MPHINTGSFWIINYFFLLTIFYKSYVKSVYGKKCVCVHMHICRGRQPWSIFLGTVSGRSRIKNSSSATDSHCFAVYCHVTIIVPLFYIAIYITASVPR